MMVETNQPEAIAIISVFCAVSTFFMALRVWSRIIAWKEDRSWDALLVWSDVLLMIAYVLAAAEVYVVITYTLITWQGYHKVDIPKLSVEQRVRGQKYNLANQLLYNPILSLVKASVMFFLLRIGNTKKFVKYALYFAQALNLALAIAIFFADAFQCTPAHYMYDKIKMDAEARKAAGADAKGQVDGVTIYGGTCINQIRFFLVSAGLAIVTDVITLIIPTIIVWDLQMPMRKKIIASGMLSVGVLVTGTSVARLVIYHWRFNPKNKDASYQIGYTISSAEANLAIACGAIPSLGPLMRRIAPTVFGSTNASQSRPTPSGYLQQSKTSTREQYKLKSYNSNNTNWPSSKHKTEAWSSDENILVSNSNNGITKHVHVDVAYSEAASVEDRVEKRQDI
ncbi:hypothetical protein ONS95_001615 [Cadophora gregata]|uniref:uncharacterized protein n=1 Tax=Cadophora gregata TaxID=51156 RepID=UPI0026DD9545|nr:uncharacterized protein ONS95_001615 [Cadophora gregata]KAK0111242.1 hypothetical protein ONS95_001615 [Cadophora gregata]KAK0112286.1 hypothetical protein ONS96_001534 [Cadophora gregata f. sp. sojae]